MCYVLDPWHPWYDADELDIFSCKAFPSGKLLSNDCKDAANEKLNRGIVLVEELSSGEDVNRNLIWTTKNNQPRYKEVLERAKWVTFYIDQLPCANIREAVKTMPSREDLTPCTTIPTARSKWFGYFAHSYGIEAAGLPSTTCFVDIVGLDLKSKSQFRVDGHTGPRLQDVCTNPVQYTASSSHSTTSSTSTTGPVPAFMLRTEERTKFEHKIRLALATKPADAITKCWIPDTINAVLPYAISSKIGACAKRAYLLKKYPQYHVSAPEHRHFDMMLFACACSAIRQEQALQ